MPDERGNRRGLRAQFAHAEMDRHQHKAAAGLRFGLGLLLLVSAWQ